MPQDEKTIETLVTGGAIGALLGAVLSKDKEEGAIIGALLGAAFAATLKAGEEAKKTKLPMYEEENGILYVITPSGEKRFIRKLKKPSRHSSERFKLD